MTNFERIKAMDKNAMADFIRLTRPSCNEYCKNATEGCAWTCTRNNGKDVIRIWLDKEVGFDGEI